MHACLTRYKHLHNEEWRPQLRRLLERSAEAVNKAKRVGIHSPEGKRLIQVTERKVLAWFRAQAKTLPVAKVSALYVKRLKQLAEATGRSTSPEAIAAQKAVEEWKAAKAEIRRLKARLKRLQDKAAKTAAAKANVATAEKLLAAARQKTIAVKANLIKAIQDEYFVTFTEWLDGGVKQFEVLMNSSIRDGLAAGFKGDLQAWINEFKLAAPPFDAAAMLPDSVIKQAMEHAGELVKGVTDDTAKQLSTVIAESLEKNLSPAQLAKTLRDRFEEIGSVKSKAIARTEMGEAVSDGAFQANKAVGADTKESIQTTDLDDICAVNEADGRIPIDQPHSSGDMHPLYHVNCMCAEAYFGATEAGVAKLLGMEG